LDSDWQQLGPHRYRLEGEILNWQPCGVVEAEHAEAVTAILVSQGKKYGAVYILMSGQQLLRITPAARAACARELKGRRVAIIIGFYGAGLVARTALTMIVRGAAVLSNTTVCTLFADTEAAARAYLAAERGRLLAERAHRPPAR
jgi:hypothetical protein